MARKAPLIEILGQAAEAPPQPKRPQWPWVAAGVVCLLAIVALGYGIFRAKQPPTIPPAVTQLEPDSTDRSAETVAVAVAVETVTNLPPVSTGLLAETVMPVAVVQPEPPRPGAIRVKATAPEYAAAFLASSTTRLRFDTNAWQTFQIFPHVQSPVPAGMHRVQVDVAGFDCVSLLGTNEATVIVASGVTNEVDFTLTPKPATLSLSCNVSNATATLVTRHFSLLTPLSVPSLQSVTLTITAPGYRQQVLRIEALLPGAVERREVTLERETGAMRVVATVPDYAQDYFGKTAKRVRLGTNAWSAVRNVPHTLTNLACGATQVAFDADGFGAATQSITVMEAQTVEATLALTPLLATLAVTCNATNAEAQVGDVRAVIGNPLSIPSLQSLDLTVSATGYVAQVVKLQAMEPGKAYRQEVKLEPLPPPPPPAAAAAVGEHGKPLTVDLGGGVKMEFVWIPPGEFLMGSPENEEGRAEDETQHRVTLTRGFWMGKYEVTQEQWMRVTSEQPSHFIGDRNPVEKIRYMDCNSFLRKLCSLESVSNGVYRMPSEAEWEYACRSGTSSAFSFGGSLQSVQANFDGNYPYGFRTKGVYSKRTLPVGSFPANAWGIHDMHGNVAEWCTDTYRPYPAGAVVDPVDSGHGSAYVIRGGNWSSSGRNCRSAARDSGTFGTHGNVVGLRIVRTAL